MIPLGQIAEVKLGKMLDKSKHTTGRKFPYLRNINVRWGRIDTSDLSEMFFKESEAERFSLNPGDVLVCEGGEPGRAAVWEGDHTHLKYQKALHRVRFLHDYEPRLLVYYLELLASRGALESRFTGSTIKHFTREAFVQLPVPNPPLPEQRRIVARIEELFSRLDAGVAALRHAKPQLQRYRQSVLAAAVTGQLTQAWREQHPDTEPAEQLLDRILEERKQQWNGSRKDKVVSIPNADNLPDLPPGWTWAPVQNLSAPKEDAIFAGPFGTIFKAKDFRDEGVPIIFLRHVGPDQYRTHKPGFMDRHLWNEIFQPYSVFGGELLVTKLGEPPGVCCEYPEDIGPAMVTPDVMKCSVNERVASKRYLVSYFNSEIARRFTFGVAFGVTRLRLTLEIFRSMPVPLPPLAEQNQIVAEVEARTTAIDHLEAELDRQITRSNRLRQSTLASAFDGRL